MPQCCSESPHCLHCQNSKLRLIGVIHLTRVRPGTGSSRIANARGRAKTPRVSSSCTPGGHMSCEPPSVFVIQDSDESFVEEEDTDGQRRALGYRG
jgi:hypothetical protein